MAYMFRRNRSFDPNDAVSYISNSAVPIATLWNMKAGIDLRYSPFMGAGPGGQLIWGRPNTHLLCLGSPQNPPGKTGSVTVTNGISHFGPMALVTTKWDAVRNITTPRLWMSEGKLPLQYNPAGPSDPGFVELRYSPLKYCTDDTSTAEEWQTLVDSAVAQDRIDANAAATDPRWMHLAKSLGCGLMRYAAEAMRNGKPYDIFWVGQQLQYKNFDDLRVVADWLISVRSVFGLGLAGYLKTGAADAGGREVHGIFTTAQIIFEPWMTKDAIRSQTDPNFDPGAFVAAELSDNRWLRDPYLDDDPTHPGHALAGQGIYPKTGTFDTIIMSIPQHQQLLAAPLIITLLGAITRAAMRRKGLDERAGYYGRPNVGLVLDELANLAPLPDLPRLLSEGASQGVTIYGCLQNATQSLARWGERDGGHAMLATFGNVICLPGVTDPYTLDWFEQLGGRTTRPTRSSNYHFDASSRAGYTDGREEVWRFPRDSIRHGHPQHPDLGLMVQGKPMDWGYCTPAHRSRPWLPLILNAFASLMHDDYLDTSPEVALLPDPDLDRFGDGRSLSHDQLASFRAALCRRSSWIDRHLDERPAAPVTTTEETRP